MRTHDKVRRFARGAVAVPLLALLLIAMPVGASGGPSGGGGLGWSATSIAANVIPGPSGGSPPGIIGGGGGSAMLGAVPYFALPQDSPSCGTACLNGWTDIIDNGVGNGGSILYVVVNVCVPETVGGTTYQTGPGCDGQTWYNTGNANWSAGGGPEYWKPTIENLDAAGITPLLYLNTFWDANSNPNTCGTSGTGSCVYTKGDIEAEQNTAADWWCVHSGATCTSASAYQITNFYYDNMSLDSTYGVTTSHCDQSLAGGASGALCNETYYDDIVTHEDSLSLSGSGNTAFLNAGDWVDNPDTSGTTDGYTSWNGNASTCQLGETGASCGEDWLMYLDGLATGVDPVINWAGSEAQFDCDYNSSYCTGTLDGVSVGSLTSTEYPSWMTNGDLDQTNFSFWTTAETVQSNVGAVGDQGLNENAWLDNEIGDAVQAGFWFGYETDESNQSFTSEATLADNEWSDMNAANGAGGNTASCAKSSPYSGQPTDPSETGYSFQSKYVFQGDSSLPTNWYPFSGFPGGVTTSYWLNGSDDTQNSNNDNEVAFDANGANLGNDVYETGVLGSGGIGDSADPVVTDGAIEWCARLSDNNSALHDVALLWPSTFAITNIVGSGTLATVTTGGVSNNYLVSGDYVDIGKVDSTPDDSCYDTSPSLDPYGVPITRVSATVFTYSTTCTDTYVSGGSESMWPPEIDLVETGGGTSFNMYYHYNDDTGSGSNSQCFPSTSIPIDQNFHVFELTWTSSTITLYKDGTSVATLSNATGQDCAGVAFPHVPMKFDFDQENTSNLTVATTNQQTDLAWIASWSP